MTALMDDMAYPRAQMTLDVIYTPVSGYSGPDSFSFVSTTALVKDALQPSLAGTSANITVSPAGVSYFTVLAPQGTVSTGTPFNVTVKALDAFGNTATGYSGHVHFASGDAKAALPP